MDYEQWKTRLDFLVTGTQDISINDMNNVVLEDWYKNGVAPEKASEMIVKILDPNIREPQDWLEIRHITGP